MAKKLEAIALLMKHFGMNAPEKSEIKHNHGWDKLFEDSRNGRPKPVDVIEAAIVEASE